MHITDPTGGAQSRDRTITVAAGPPSPTAPRRTRSLLVIGTAIGSLGLGAGGTAGSLVAVQVTGDEATAGVPLGLLVVGSAFGALLIARVSHHRGRLVGLSVGYVLGVLGAVLVVAATQASTFSVVLVGSFLLGAANPAVFMSRYAAADLASTDHRGRALGGVLAATAGGAIAGAFLLGPAGAAATSLRLSAPAGLYIVAVPAFALAALLLWRVHAGAPSESGSVGGSQAPRPVGVLAPTVRGVRPRASRTAMATLGAGNLSMTALMVVMPVHLAGHGHQLSVIGLLIAVHVAGMFVPSPLAGQFADRVDGRSVGLLGLAVIMATAIVWSWLSDPSSWTTGILLLSLGIGWNGTVVGGSAMLAAEVGDASRVDAEAAGEVVMGLAAGVGAPLAGILIGAAGFEGVCLAVAVICGMAWVGCRKAGDMK